MCFLAMEIFYGFGGRYLGITNLKPGKIPSRQEKCSDISLIVFGLWEKASVPSICLKFIYNKVNKLIEKYQRVRKSINKTTEVSINMRDICSQHA